MAALGAPSAGDFERMTVRHLGAPSSGDFERMTVHHLGALMLARIDGKSPVEYIRDEETKDRVRRVAKRILRERPQELEEVMGIVMRETHGPS